MNKISKNEKGFSAVEVILVVVIVALIGIVGWLVYKDHHKTIAANIATTSSNKPATTNKTTATQQVNQYAGWQSFCSSYGGLCLKYPPNWTIKTTSEAVSISQNTVEANITSPSGNVTVQYQPYCTQLVAPPSGTYTDDILSVTSPSGTSDFKVIKAVSSYRGSSSSNVSESLYLTSDSVVQQNGITVGYHTDSSGVIDEAAAGFFANTKASDPSNLQCMNVGSLKNSTGGNYLNFSSPSAAQAWFSNSEAQTAAQILGSVSYSH